MSVCPRCGQALPDEAKYCNVCGQSLVSVQPRPPDGGMRVCSSCGTQNSASMSTCGMCGKVLGGISSQTPASLERRAVDIFDARASSQATVTPIEPPRTTRSGKLTVAALMLVIAGIMGFASAVLVMTADLEGSLSPAELQEISEILDTSTLRGGCAVVCIFGGVCAILGGILSWRVERFGLAVAGAALGMLTLGPYSMGSILAFVSMILVALSKEDFKS